jgi:hypothetical protein
MELHTGSCFCGEVSFTVAGKPALMCYCHCESCRQWSAAPVTGVALWKPEAVKLTAGAEKLGTFNRTSRAYRQWCRVCGGHLFTDNPGLGLLDVFPAVISQFAFEPVLHVNYGEALISIKDGLPKFMDLPKEFGGSGEMLPE